MYMAALSRMRVQSPTANSHHHLTPRLPHTCPAAPDRAPRGRARLSQHRSRRPRYAAPHRAPPTSSHPVPPHRQCSRWGRRCCSPKPAPQTCFAPHTLQRGTRPAWRPQPPWSPHSSGHALGQRGHRRDHHGQLLHPCCEPTAAAVAVAPRRRGILQHTARRGWRWACHCPASSSASRQHDGTRCGLRRLDRLLVVAERAPKDEALIERLLEARLRPQRPLALHRCRRGGWGSVVKAVVWLAVVRRVELLVERAFALARLFCSVLAARRRVLRVAPHRFGAGDSWAPAVRNEAAILASLARLREPYVWP